MQRQAVHGLKHRAEVLLAHPRAARQLLDGDAERVHDRQLQAERDRHGLHRGHDALDHDQELGAAAEQAGHPGHPREAEEAEEAQDLRALHGVRVPRRQQDRREHPGLGDHEHHEDGVEHEPRVRERRVRAQVGLESADPLEGEGGAEQVLGELEARVRVDQQVLAVELRVDAYPDRVRQDREQRKEFERLALHYALCPTLLLESHRHRALQLHTHQPRLPPVRIRPH
mmetsp:Transcript_100943/g.314702  ORF Transcript_100943/g.314702 Transcript_100943/m.314702 type:complete len:228 (-) Transcript_100943:208-891(-)